ncbi:MAG: hypothetical protein EHM72_18660, partial [Calditrichaeota bacterium]
MTACEPILKRSILLFTVCWLLLFQLFDSHLPAQSDNDPHQATAATLSLIHNGNTDLSSLGMVVGAAFDQESGRLALIGNGEHLECSPTWQQFAVALRYAFRDSAYNNFLSIDPLPDNPTSPYMTIRMNQDVRDTEFGWVMFEADRKLKCLSMGEDNYFGITDQSRIPGFANIPEMTLQKGDVKDQNELWSRFWFYPTECAVDTSREALFIRRAQIRIKTQTMKWEKGKLVTAEGMVDETSEKFAASVNEHFEQLADETPVFRHLEQLLRLLLVGDWIRNQNFPVNLEWIHACASTPFRMPRLTPAITVTNERRITDDKGITIQTWQIYGGVDLDYTPVMTELPSARTPWQPPQTALKTEMECSQFTYDGQSYTAASFSPLLFKTVNPAVTEMAQLTLPNGKPFTISKRKTETPNPHLQISQESQMALPLLPSFYPQGHKGQIEYIRTSDPAQEEIVLKHYQLYDRDGQLLGIFKEHDVDPISGRIQVRAEDPHSDWVLYPEAQGAVWAQSRDGRLWVFENQYGLPIGERVDDQFIRYHYNQQGILDKASVENSSDEISFTHGQNGAQI